MPLAHRILNSLSKHSPTVRAELEAQLETFWFDVCTAVNAPAFGGLRALVPTDRMLFGTDYPYVDMEETIGDLVRLDLTAHERYAIEAGNALRLFPRFAAQGKIGAA